MNKAFEHHTDSLELQIRYVDVIFVTTHADLNNLYYLCTGAIIKYITEAIKQIKGMNKFFHFFFAVILDLSINHMKRQEYWELGF